MHARRTCLAAAIALIAASVPSASAQFIDACVTGNAVGIVSFGISSTNAAPFSGTIKTTFEQKLSDGNAIHRVTRTHQARDSAGRTMTENSAGCMLGPDGTQHSLINVNVNDPVAHTHMNWLIADGQPKVANLLHLPDPLQRATPSRAARPAPDPAQLQKMRAAAQAQQARMRAENHTEDLGTRDFNGVSARGTRTTRTIPAGEEGNDQPLVVVTEIWRSTELGIAVMTLDDDPRRGRTTTEYEDLLRGEPDPSLFDPPAGYTIKEQPQPQLGIISGMVQ